MYLELLKQILSIVNRENDLNGNNIVEKIKGQIKERCSSTYEEWSNKNFDINYKFIHNGYSDKKKSTLLSTAFLDNQENVVKALLAVDGINVNFQYQLDKTLLHLAIEKGNEKIVEALLNKGARVDLKDVYGKAPLHLAIEKGDEKIVKALLNKGASVDLKDVYGKAPLHLAIEKGDEKIVKALLNKGASVNLPDKSGSTPLHLAIRKGDENIVNALLAVKGIDVNLRDSSESAPLYLAAEKGKMEIVEAILDKNPSIIIFQMNMDTLLCPLLLGDIIKR
ncbi:ankyrin repeat domain-containing protein [Wolbachia endosymbiont (group A) of Limnophora tigrina]|uniref:ankyrin repeat domain-containing protein n=1 Tax=Wolbachia endosymbiont (group A) of Limnophora tigrina TaxID=3139318 RepID=UPI0035B52DAC